MQKIDSWVAWEMQISLIQIDSHVRRVWRRPSPNENCADTTSSSTETFTTGDCSLVKCIDILRWGGAAHSSCIRMRGFSLLAPRKVNDWFQRRRPWFRDFWGTKSRVKMKSRLFLAQRLGLPCWQRGSVHVCQTSRRFLYLKALQHLWNGGRCSNFQGWREDPPARAQQKDRLIAAGDTRRFLTTGKYRSIDRRFWWINDGFAVDKDDFTFFTDRGCILITAKKRHWLVIANVKENFSATNVEDELPATPVALCEHVEGAFPGADRWDRIERAAAAILTSASK